MATEINIAVTTTTYDVTIVAEPNEYIVNITTSGGGGSPALQQVTTEGNTTTNDVIVSDGADNETIIKKGQILQRDSVGNNSEIGTNGALFINVDGTDVSIANIAAVFGTQETGLFLTTQQPGKQSNTSLKLAPEYFTDLDFTTRNVNCLIPFKPDGTYTLAFIEDLANYLQRGGGTMETGANIFFANGSKISEGVVNAGTGGNKGIALTCAVGYEFKWEAGEVYITNLSGNTIESKFYARNTPTVNDDITKGYVYYSFWNTFSGSNYRCLDNTAGAAVWELLSSSAWGSITGTLSAQTDLQNALNLKQNDLTTFQRKEGIDFFDDFLGTNDNAGINTNTGVVMTATGTGSLTRITGTYPNRTIQQGVLQLVTGTTATGTANFRLGSGNIPTFFIGGGVISYEVFVNIETLSTLANRFVNVFGTYTGLNTQSSNNAICFVYDEGGVWGFGAIGASPNWRCITVNGGTRTTTNSTIAVTASAWTKLRIEINATGTSVDFYINNTLAATHTTNIPATTTAMHFFNSILKTTGTTSINTYGDYLSLKQKFTTAR